MSRNPFPKHLLLLNPFTTQIGATILSCKNLFDHKNTHDMTSKFTMFQKQRKFHLSRAVLLLFIVLSLANFKTKAQFVYSQNFDAGVGSWTGGFQLTTVPCSGTGVLAFNLYASATSTNYISPSLGTALAIPTTLSFDYKIANWSANNVATTGNWGTCLIQWSNSAAGPWTTIATIDQTNHIASASCANKTYTFTPTAGSLFIRYSLTWASGDYYFNVDNVNVSNLLTCSGVPASPVVTPSSISKCIGQTQSLSSTGATVAAGISYQWQVSNTPGGPYVNVSGGTGATTVNYTTSVFNTPGVLYYVLKTYCSNTGDSSISNEVPVTVNVLPNVSSSSSSASFCQGGSGIILTASSTDPTPPTFAWTPTSTVSPTSGSVVTAIPTTSTTYTVTATNSFGCTNVSTSSIIYSVSPTITSVTATPSNICLGNTSTLNVVASPGAPGPLVISEITTFMTGTGATNPYPAYMTAAASNDDFMEIANLGSTPLSLDNYVFQIWTGTALSKSFTFPVGTTISGNSTIVLGSGTAGAVVPNVYYNIGGSNGLYSSGSANGYILKSPSGSVVDAVAQNSYVFPAASGVVIGVDWSGNVPSTSGTAGLKRTGAVDNNTAANWSVVSAASPGNFGAISSTILPYAPISGYLWSPLLDLVGGIDNIQSPVADMGGSGATTTFTVSVTNVNNCTSTGTITVNVAGGGGVYTQQAPAISPANGTICLGQSITIKDTVLNGGAPFQWYLYKGTNVGDTLFNASTSTNTMSLTTSPSIAQSGVYTLSVSDFCGGFSSMTVSITVNALPVVSISNPSSLICGSGSIALTASGALSYLWSPSASLNVNNAAAVNASPTITTTYTTVGTDVNGCTASSTVTISYGANPVITSSATPANVCLGSSSTLTASGAVLSTGPQTQPSGYCASGAVNLIDEEIYSFNFNGFSTPALYAGCSGCATLSNACGTGGNNAAPGPGSVLSSYSNFTTLGSISNLTAGSTYTYAVNENECDGATFFSFGTAIFIDYNRDGDFLDAGETIFQEPTTAVGPRTISGSLTVPATVTPGITRMRIMVAEGFSGTGLTPCLAMGYGETEDYLVNLIGNVALNSTDFTWSPSTFLSATTGNNVVASSMTSSQTYVVTATSSLGCTTTASVPVSVGTALTCNPITSSNGTTLCEGSSTKLKVTANGGGLPYSYLWYNGATPFSAADSVVVSPSAGTTVYSVVVTDQCGQSCAQTITINVNAYPVVTINPANSIICFTGSSTLTAGGANTYVWNTGATTNAISVSPTAASTIYTVTGTDALGCTNTSTAQVKYSPAFTVIAKATPAAICAGSTSTLSVYDTSFVPTNLPLTPPSGYCVPTYTSGTGFGDFIQGISGLISNSTGAGPAPYVSLTSSPVYSITSGSTYTINVTTGTYSFNDVAAWIDYNRNGTFDAAEKLGEFDNLGAAGVASFVFTVPNTASAGTTRIRIMEADQSTTGGMLPCAALGFGETEDYLVNITAPTAVISTNNIYTWSPATNLSSATGSSTVATLTTSETFTVVSTDANGCSNSSTVSVAAGVPLVCAPVTAVPSAICAGQSASLTAGVSGGGAPYTYVWSTSAGTVGSTASINVSPAATTVYTVVVTDNCNVSCSQVYTLTVNPLPNVSISPSTSLICFTGNSVLTASGADTYVWSTTETTNPISVAPTATATYTVTGTTTSTGCTNTAVQTIAVNKFYPSVSASAAQVCIGSTSTLTATTSAGPTTLPSGYCTASSGCDEAVNTFILGTINNVTTCSGGYADYTSISTNVVPGQTYTTSVTTTNTYTGDTASIWLDANRNGSFEANELLTKLFGYNGTIQTVNGSVTVPANASFGKTLLRVRMSYNTAANPCGTQTYGETEDYSVNIIPSTPATYSYTWNPGAIAGSTLTVTPTASTVYTVTSSDVNGCSTTATVSVTVNNPIVTATAAPASVFIGSSSTLTASGATTYAWTDSSVTTTLSTLSGATTVATPSVTTTYTVVGTDGLGCTASATASVTVITLSMTASGQNLFCNGDNSGEITANATGGIAPLSYSLNGGTSQSSNVFSGLAAGSYTVQVTDAASNTATAVVSITQPTAIVTTASSTNVTCFGANNGSLSAIATGGTPFTGFGANYIYDWYNSSDSIINVNNDSTVSGLGAGTYYVVVEDFNGCIDTTLGITITEPAMISSSFTVTSCDSAALPWMTVTSSGTYTNMYTAANGCDSLVTAIVTINSTSVTVSANATSLFTNDALQLTITAPTGANSYAWSGPGGLTSNTNQLNATVTSANSGVYTATVVGTNGCTGTATISITVTPGSMVAMKVFLGGAYNTSTGMMNDNLRALNLIPTTEPYSSAPYSTTYSHVNGGGGETVAPAVLAVTGNDAIVDWVFLQLRSKNDDKIVLGTKAALVQRDGDVVSTDGVSPVLFKNNVPDLYYVSVEHRNHLGVMTFNKYALSETPTTLNLTNGSVPLFLRAAPANNPAPLTGATKPMGGVNVLYGGNCNLDLAAAAYRIVSYTPLASSDRAALIGATGPTGTIPGYTVFDVNMDGQARFNGLNPDRLTILGSTMGSNTIIVNEQTPN